MTSDPTANIDAETEDDAPEHSIKATRDLAKAIRDAVADVDAADDVWATINVNEPDNPKSMMIFRVENDDLYYDVQILPVDPVEDD